MTTQNHDTNRSGLDQDAQKQGANLDQGKRLVNPASPELSGDIGKRKAQDYPGADEGVTGQQPEDRSRQQAQDGYAQGQKPNPQANLGNRKVVDDEDEDAGESARGWDSAGNSAEANPYRKESGNPAGNY